MTTRICLFGNSHIAALRSARAPSGRRDRLRIDMVGAHGEGLMETRVEDGILVPTTPGAAHAFRRFGGGDGIDLEAYDAFGIVGCQVSIAQAVARYRHARWVGMAALAQEEDLATMGPRLISRAFFMEDLAHRLSETLGGRFADHLRQSTSKPIVIISQPRPSVRVLQSALPRHRPFASAVKMGDARLLSAVFEESARTMAAAVTARFIPQPVETIEDHITTGRDWTDGALRLSESDKPQPEEDTLHANATYGAEVLKSLRQIFA